jgi:ankyrin repeat protein
MLRTVLLLATLISTGLLPTSRQWSRVPDTVSVRAGTDVPRAFQMIEVHSSRDSILDELRTDPSQLVQHVEMPGFTERIQILHLAAIRGRADLISALVTAGAPVDGVDARGRQPLTYAAMADRVTTAQALLTAGASVTARQDNGQTAFHWAVRASSPDMLDLLAQAGTDVLARDNVGNTALLCATYATQYRYVNIEWLLHHGVSPRIYAYDGNSVVHQLVYADDTDTIKLVLKHGATLEAQTHGYRPIVRAMNCEDPVRMITFLLDNGADANGRDAIGMTPLMHAAQDGRDGLIGLLVERGADLESVDSRGRTALFCAVEFEHAAVVRALLDLGADPGRGRRHPFTTLEQAQRKAAKSDASEAAKDILTALQEAAKQRVR